MRVSTTLLLSLFLLASCSTSRPVAYKNGVAYEPDGNNHWCAKKDAPEAKKSRRR